MAGCLHIKRGTSFADCGYGSNQKSIEAHTVHSVRMWSNKKEPFKAQFVFQPVAYSDHHTYGSSFSWFPGDKNAFDPGVVNDWNTFQEAKANPNLYPKTNDECRNKGGNLLVGPPTPLNPCNVVHDYASKEEDFTLFYLNVWAEGANSEKCGDGTYECYSHIRY